jgi:hypothetical protein
MILPHQSVNLAFGLQNVMYNVALAISSVYFGNLIVPRTIEAYNKSLKSLTFITLISLLLSLLVFWLDVKNGRIL